MQLAADGGETESTARIRINLATAQNNLGEYEQAERNLELAQAPLEAALGPDHHRVAEVLHARAMVFSQSDRPGEAVPLLERTIEIFERTFGPDHPALGTFQYNYADVLLKADRSEEAQVALERSLAIRRRSKTAPELAADTARLLARVRIEAGADVEETGALFEEAIELYGAAEIDRASDIAEARALLAELRRSSQ